MTSLTKKQHDRRATLRWLVRAACGKPSLAIVTMMAVCVSALSAPSGTTIAAQEAAPKQGGLLNPEDLSVERLRMMTSQVAPLQMIVDVTNRIFVKSLEYKKTGIAATGEVDFQTNAGVIPGMVVDVQLYYKNGEEQHSEFSIADMSISAFQRRVPVDGNGQWRYSIPLGSGKGLIPGEYTLRARFLPNMQSPAVKQALRNEVRILNPDSELREVVEKEYKEEEEAKEKAAKRRGQPAPKKLVGQERNDEIKRRMEAKAGVLVSSFLAGESDQIISPKAIRFLVVNNTGDYFVDRGSLNAANELLAFERRLDSAKKSLSKAKEELKKFKKNNRGNLNAQQKEQQRQFENDVKNLGTYIEEENTRLLELGGVLTVNEHNTLEKLIKVRRDAYEKFYRDFEDPLRVKYFRLVEGGDLDAWWHLGVMVYGRPLLDTISKQKWPWDIPIVRKAGDTPAPLGSEKEWKKYRKERIDIRTEGDESTWTEAKGRRARLKEERGGDFTPALAKELKQRIDNFEITKLIDFDQTAEEGKRFTLNHDECRLAESRFWSFVGVRNPATGAKVQSFDSSSYRKTVTIPAASVDEGDKEITYRMRFPKSEPISAAERVEALNLGRKYGVPFNRYPNAYKELKSMMETCAYMPITWRYYILRSVLKLPKAQVEEKIGPLTHAPKSTRHGAGTSAQNYKSSKKQCLELLAEKRSISNSTPLWNFWYFYEGPGRNYPQDQEEQHYVAMQRKLAERYKEVQLGTADTSGPTQIITSGGKGKAVGD